MSETQRPKIKKVIEDFGEQRVNWWNYAEELDYAENRWVRFDDVAVPRGFTVVLDNDAEIEVDMTLEGPVIVETRGDVPADNHRLLNHAVAMLGARLSGRDKYGLLAATEADVAYARKQYGKHRLKPGYDLTGQKLKEVARVYLEAKTDGRNCLAAVANYFKISPTTAKDWVRRARALGYLD